VPYAISSASCCSCDKTAHAVVQVSVLGGGRISHDPTTAAAHLYGYSSAFGPAPHEVAAALLRRWLPLHTVTTSYEGY
jgi:Janus/Ocnus family (Ocnus)